MVLNLVNKIKFGFFCSLCVKKINNKKNWRKKITFSEKMSGTLIFAALQKLESFGYGKNGSGYNHYVKLKQINEEFVHCTLFLHTGTIHKSHEFQTKWEDLFAFLDNSNAIFEHSLQCDTILGEVKMSENWPVDIENLRVGLLKITRQIFRDNDLLLSQYILRNSSY
jgi:hypothetical protein